MDKGIIKNINRRDKIVLATPIFFTIHNLEEAVGMKKWIENDSPLMLQGVTINHFLFALTILTIIGFIFTIYSLLWNKGESFSYLMNGFVGLIFLNAFFPHILGTILLKQYTPGVITSLIIYLPLGIYVFYEHLNKQKIGKSKFIISILVGCLTGIVLTVALLTLGKVIF